MIINEFIDLSALLVPERTAIAFEGRRYSYAELKERVSEFLGRLKQHTAEQTILVVAHSGPLRLMLCCLLEIDVKHWRQFSIDLASLSIVETYPRIAVIRLLNGTSHLGENV